LPLTCLAMLPAWPSAPSHAVDINVGSELCQLTSRTVVVSGADECQKGVLLGLRVGPGSLPTEFCCESSVEGGTGADGSDASVLPRSHNGLTFDLSKT
jgi:hypothetical protein